ncbi:MAG: circularly permuted type 2 ATP-grasp protein, partial [Microvirga sp.]
MNGHDGEGRAAYRVLQEWLKSAPVELLERRRAEAELLFRKVGITFAVYGNAEAEERLIPFDIVPRILSGREWGTLSRGLEQRVTALNMFLKDIYGPREILRAGIVPDELVFQNPYYRPQMNGLALRGGIYVQVAGVDIVRVDDDDFYVLEDNLRTPSGVSYMLENREVMLRLFPDLMAMQRIRPIENYVNELLATLKSV